MHRGYFSRNRVLAALAIVAVLAGTAAASSYITKASLEANDTAVQQRPQQQPGRIAPKAAIRKNGAVTQKAVPAQPIARCNDSNILGTVAGGAVGGILGHQVGKGSGNAVATIGGTLGGAYLGNQYIPLQNATCRN